MGKKHLTDKELAQTQPMQLIFMDFMSRNASQLIDEYADELPAPFFYNEGVNNDMIGTMEESDYDYKAIDEQLPFGRMFTNCAVENIFHVSKKTAEYMGLDFVNRFIDPEFIKSMPAQTELFKRKEDGTVLSIVHRIREDYDKPFEWALASLKYHKEKNTVIGFITPFRILSQVGQKFNRMMDEYSFMKNNIQKYSSLTPRELEIIRQLVRGLNNPQIAEMLFISRQTVEQHRKNINRKLEIKAPTELIRFALAFDLV